MELTYILQDIDSAAKTVLEAITSKTLLFNGEMGSGKTTFIKALVKALGSEDTVSSPTFSIVNEYQTQEDSIYHFDLYRIESTDELYQIGIEDYLATNSWKMIEWPDRLGEIDLDATNILTFYTEKTGERRLKLDINERITPNSPMYNENLT
ncbi:tRNA (adenosine(37)-N6)-threonylcarbamoyltransferase complex ATPase subunit type 1 TsaE [Winogradskyella sp. 3972H.M.0a.05]|uniref:tRNA (adenosine(37)-N6)-threonylcarbamoyltransferase complex ATPase subunit type 1 TsaE n=1 Tax=Winogradskyella sp. 3972H.M.0a.05 TaxID=2950277 RepID=UPI0033924C18